MEFRSAYLVRVPLPLARLYDQAHNDNDPRRRHDSAFCLHEALVKLAAAVLIATYLEDADRELHRTEEIDQLLLTSLALPSLGHWQAMLRELSRYFATAAPGKG